MVVTQPPLTALPAHQPPPSPVLHPYCVDFDLSSLSSAVPSPPGHPDPLCSSRPGAKAPAPLSVSLWSREWVRSPPGNGHLSTAAPALSIVMVSCSYTRAASRHRAWAPEPSVGGLDRSWFLTCIPSPSLPSLILQPRSAQVSPERTPALPPRAPSWGQGAFTENQAEDRCTPSSENLVWAPSHRLHGSPWRRDHYDQICFAREETEAQKGQVIRSLSQKTSGTPFTHTSSVPSHIRSLYADGTPQFGDKSNARHMAFEAIPHRGWDPELSITAPTRRHCSPQPRPPRPGHPRFCSCFPGSPPSSPDGLLLFAHPQGSF